MEYPNVLKTSRDRKALEAAWQKKISENDALTCIGAYLDEGEVEVCFTARTRGTAWAGERGVIRLPGDKTGNLTLGLVLHEIAHIIAINDRGQRGHGPGFVKTLDGMVFSEANWRE